MDVLDLSTQLKALGFTKKLGVSVLSFIGNLNAGNINVPIEVKIPDLNFVTLPIIEIDAEFCKKHKLRSHLAEGNTLCYTDDNELVLDPYQSVGSIRAVLDLCEITLREMLHENPDPAIRAEITSYWKGDTYYLIDNPNQLSEGALGYIENSKGRAISVIGQSKEAIQKWAKEIGPCSEFIRKLNIVHIHGDIPPPPVIKHLADASKWIGHLTNRPSDWLLENILDDKAPSVMIVGDNGIIGFTAEPNNIIKQAEKGVGFRKSAIHSLWKKQSPKVKINRFHVRISTHDEIISRNLDFSPPLCDKKICLIGCGTIGGYLARLLVQNGAGAGAKFNLIDDQVFLPENIGRHILGFSSVGKYKSEAMCEELACDFPALKIEPITQSAQDILGQFKTYDLIIDATGTERFSSVLNLYASKTRKTASYPPIIYSMIFNNGVAVQSFLDKGSNEDACYQCLKPVHGEPWRFFPVKSSANSKTVSVRACSVGSYIPYGVEASVSAALLTLKQILDYFSGNTSQTLRTTIIDSDNGSSPTNKTINQSSKCPACFIKKDETSQHS